MAIFTSIENCMIEAAFDMGGGLVLDFNNRTFAEFIEEQLGFDPYTKPQYGSLSKAKILRKLLKDEKNEFAGKLILKLIEYREFKEISNSGDKYIPKLIELGNIKLGKTKDSFKIHENKSINITDFNSNKYLTDLLNIEKSQLSQQQKGYAFEQFLNQLFKALNLSPRASYRTATDQIDGSFLLDGNTVLLEAKYRGASPSKDDLIIFANKIATKSQFTRGLFICQAKIPDYVVDYFKLTERKTFIVMTVEELYLVLSESQDPVGVLRQKFRYLEETGIVFKHYREII